MHFSNVCMCNKPNELFMVVVRVFLAGSVCLLPNLTLLPPLTIKLAVMVILNLCVGNQNINVDFADVGDGPSHYLLIFRQYSIYSILLPAVPTPTPNLPTSRKRLPSNRICFSLVDWRLHLKREGNQLNSNVILSGLLGMETENFM